jgi:hypothetical protein
MISVFGDSHDCVGFLRSAGPRALKFNRRTQMETYEPLKSPEIHRDDATGRFERKGLAKAAKFRPEQPAKTFQPGVSRNLITAPPDRMRWLRDGVVEQLAESVGASGLIEPIVVRPRKVGPYLAAVET